MRIRDGCNGKVGFGKKVKWEGVRKRKMKNVIGLIDRPFRPIFLDFRDYIIVFKTSKTK